MNFFNLLCNSEKLQEADYRNFFKIAALIALFVLTSIAACNVLEKKICDHKDDFMKQDRNEESCVDKTS